MTFILRGIFTVTAKKHFAQEFKPHLIMNLTGSLHVFEFKLLILKTKLVGVAIKPEPDLMKMSHYIDM